MDWGSAAEAKITNFLELLRSSGLQFEYALHRGADAGVDAADGDVAADNLEGGPRLSVDITGPDAFLMTERGGELLHAIESIAASILRLSAEEHDQLSFDALGFKERRREATERLAEQAIDTVRSTSKPYVFAPMNSRERRMLHLILATSGFPTASSGEGPRRFVVLYPVGTTPTPERFSPPVTNGRPPSWIQGRRRPRAAGHLTSVTAGPRTHEEKIAAPAIPLDPNGNPLEQDRPAPTQIVSEEERLASLRRAFRSGRPSR